MSVYQTQKKMSTFMDKISHIVSLANSAKVADHKKAIKFLTELWEDHSEEDLQQISNYSDYLLSSESTRKEGYYSLNDVFIIVHNLFESEINRIHNLKGQNSGKLDKERITKLLYHTSEKASNHLKPKTVVNSTLSILQYHKVQIFSEYYEVYLSILKKYVLRERSQRVLVPYAQWQELLQVCTTILEHKLDDINYVELLETLELVIRHGCSMSNLLFETKKLLPIISDLFENYQSYNIKSTDILFKLCFTVCQQIASDSRYILCSFSESLPLSLIEFKGPEEKYELYLLFVQVHHPNGALLRDDTSHVCDVGKWKATLQLLYKMVLKDIKLAILPKSHLALACEVFRQKMFTKIPESLTQSSMFQESAYIQPRKKRRISDSEAQDRLIDLVNDRDPERAWPVIQIAASLYKKYPDCLKFEECIEFLDVTVKLMSQSKDFSIMESLCELATVIAQNNEIHTKDDLGIYWNKIWDAVLRFLSMSHKQIVEKGCVLIQNLIYYKRISNPQSILKLFTSKSIQKSNHSIQTLKVFCESNILPNGLSDSDVNSELLTNNSLKLQLLRWNLDPFPKRLTHSLSIQNFSKLLIGFTLKTWYKQDPQVLQIGCHDEYCISMENNFYEDMQSITIDDIEQCYLSLNSKNHLAFKLNIQDDVQKSNEENFDNPFVSEDLDFLLNNLIQIVQTEGAENELDVFIIKTAVIATVITDLKAMNMIQSSFDEFCLVKELKTCLSKIMIEIRSIDWSKYLRRINYTLEITRSLTLLYQTKFDTSVNDIIINATTFDAVKKINEIRQYENSESPKLPICQINAIITLALCSCMNIGQDMMDFQLTIASTLLKMKKYRLSNRTDVISVLTMLKIFSNVPNTRATDQLTELVIFFVQQLFIEWQRDDRVNRCLLQLLPKFLDKVAVLDDKEHIHNIFLICKHYHDKFARGEFGQLTHRALVKCLNSIVNHRTFMYSSEIEVLDDDVFMTFVKSPYYLVRFESLKYVYSIFSSKKIDHTWKENFFHKLRDFVINIFIIQRDLTADEIQEERLIRSISVLQTLTTVICSQSIFQSPALLTLAQIVKDKDIDTGIVQKGLKAIDNCGLSSKNIIECNLNYILTNWCRSDRSLISFPFILTDYTTDTSFYETYAHIIFPILIREGKIEESKRFCLRLEAPFRDLFKSCCASIIPWALSSETPGTLENLQSNAGLFQDIGDFSTLVRRNLDQIIAETVQRLRDLNHFYATFKTTTNLPDRDPPYYKRDVVDQCFDRLNQIVFDEHPRTLFHCLLTRQPSTAQKVLLQLTRNIYADSMTEYRALALHQYAYFCQKIIVDLTESHCDIVATYFIKDIIFTLLHLAKEDDKYIVGVACTYLHVLLENLLPNRSAQVGQILDLCVKSLAPLVSEPSGCEPARNVLELLLIRNKECLAEQIKHLTSLPDCEPWNTRPYNNYGDADNRELKQSLRDFMRASDDHDCNVDSLWKLKRQLTTKESELEALYEELESSQGFAEDCASSLLHNLIYRLIQLTKSQDANIALEAAKCLGVLGPANLFTTILHPQERPIKEANKIEILTNKFCQILADLVLSADIETRMISSDALYVLSEYECRETSESLQEFLFPFQSAHKLKVSRKKVKLEIDDSLIYETFDTGGWWSTKSDEPYKAWISGLTSAVAMVLIGFCTENLIPLFKLDVQSCEMALPRLLDIIIETDASMADMICSCINAFFHHHFGPLSSMNDASKMMRECNARDAVRCILNVVHHLRIQTDEKLRLDFDYLTIAVAAQFSSAYFSSILYTELWCRSKLKSSRDFDSIPIIDQICEDHCSRGKDAQDILREAYIKIGDSDSIHGWGCSYLEEQKPKIPYYTNFQKLDKLALLHDIDCSIRKVPERGLITALRGLSLHYLASRLLNTASSQADSMDDLNYDCFWRLSDWNQVTNFQTSSSNNETGNFPTFHYESLKCLHESNKSSLNKSLEKAHFCIIKELNNISLESCKAVYPKLTQLQMLHEIEEFNSSDPKEYDNLLKKWMGYKYICNNDLQYVEPILTQRTVICKIRESFRNNFQYAFVGTQYKIAQLAQQEGNFSVAGRALEIVSKEKGFDYNDIYRLKYHEALLALKTKDEDMARYNFRSIINYEYLDPSLRAQVLRDYGNWIAENKSENPQAIISKYFEKAIAAYSDVTEMTPDDFSDQSKALAALAQFSHEQYLIICDYMNSSQFESLQECIDYSRNVNNNKPIKKGDKDVERAFIITDRQSRIDSIEIANIKKDKAMYLALALTNYLQTLQKSDEHDFLNFRLVSLWLSAENMYDVEVNRILEGQLERIPSYKFIPLVPQLAPHMSNVGDTFTSKINKLLERCAKDHPHHTLPVLLALKNLYGDSKYCNKKNSTIEARVLGAQQLVQQLLSSDIRPIVQEMDKTSEALVMLAYYDSDKKKAVVPKCSIPRNLLINEIKNFKHSIVPTMTLDIKKNCSYTNIVSIRKYESSYDNVGGINAPKKIICIGTDGKQRPQLVKGRDDLRQDAVMQQVFTVMNSLLKTNKDAKQRNLHVRTYKVVPLTQRSGVLEWCNNTLPISNILTGDGKRSLGLHQKYYPKNFSPMECRKRIQAAKGNQLFNVFMDCCTNLPPAFHHFFTENYLSPEIWFERRSAYTKSVATTSIIGYILGLGDRHVSNILIDQSTAEVIHIDFGIAFEQGKVLPTPETVPFRLTRDMEAGMGVTGVEGTMRRCCEQTVSVLREQKEIIVTLLRVLLYDPLYSWAITPAKAATYQSEHSTRSSESKDSNSPGVAETNKLAERALLRVQQKLQGIEEGVSSSISGQVTRLIQQARDPANLCRLFAGWQAYL